MATIGRNDPCPCGSGKKYKKCCEAKEQAAEFAALEKRHAQALKAAESAKKTEAAKPGGPPANPAKPAGPRGLPEHRRNVFAAPKFNMPRKTGGG